MRAIDAIGLKQALAVSAILKDKKTIEQIIDEQPTIEPRCEECEAFNKTRLLIPQPERKKGKWQITDTYPHNVYCSECHKRFAQTHWTVWEDGSLPRNFCPNCGSDMRKEDT